MKTKSLYPCRGVVPLRAGRSRILPALIAGLGLILAGVGSASAAVRYVNVNSANATPPYTDWTTAATNIQDAVDAAVAGDEVVVTNGTYATGGRAVYGTMTNRVAVDKPLALRSVNGPQFTVIQGRQAPGITNGDGAIRCVYLTNGASLSGFALTNGATRAVFDFPTNRESSGGGLWCESSNAVAVSNCVVAGNSASTYGGGAYGGKLDSCTLSGNSANSGGGAYYGILNNCTLSGNSASGIGGGAYYGILNNCTLSGNSAYDGGGAAGSPIYNAPCTLNNCKLTGNWSSGGYGAGGGAFQSTLNNCTLSGNWAEYGEGGGVYQGTLNNCTLIGNSATGISGWGSYSGGGGAVQSTLYNCTLAGNSANYGGGALGGTLNNCTLTGNSAVALDGSGGGASGSTFSNCIAYFNHAPQGANYDSGCILNFCCTTPQPSDGTGNITLDPQLASASHLSAASPCRGAGSAAYASGTDIDGEAWANPPSIGCDEYNAGAVTGPLNVAITASFTNVATGFAVQLTALIEGRTVASIWDFGDGLTATNQPYTAHAWAAPGDYTVLLRAYNETQPGGISATVTIHVGVQPIHYVAAASANPVAPYTSWATAATNIQDAVDAAAVPGALVLVTNGIYATGGRAVGTDLLTNRVAVNKPLALRSANGPQSTAIDGSRSARCVYLASGAGLSGFTLTNGAARALYDFPGRDARGGGLWCESNDAVVSNCVVVGNSAYYGGGAYYGTLNNCTLSSNSVHGDHGDNGYGGGAYGCTLDNCTLSGNSASGSYDAGGGAYDCTLNNCTLTGNGAYNAGGAFQSTLNNCTLSRNWAGYAGGGAYGCTLANCTLSANSANAGGGAAGATLINCTLTGNSANVDYYGSGGGAYDCTLNNCTVSGNSAWYGGGANGCTLNNCTLSGNSGGGALGCSLANCIAYFNSGANYDSSCTLNYSCTTPLPASGVGNISSNPQLASASHLSALSPCIGKGSYASVSGTDIDGQPWANPPSIGCDEYHAGTVTGPLSVAITAPFTNVTIGYPADFTALIEGRTTTSTWDFGDGSTVTNQPYTSHAWTGLGDYAVILRAYNESQPGGISATVNVQVVVQPVHYVAAASAHPVAPYTSWATAATNIQDAIDAATEPGASVLVTNGVYGGGTAGYAAVIVNRSLIVRSVNGPLFTIINGGKSNPCAQVTDGASLSGFTLTNGAGGVSGSGLSLGGTLDNCIVSGNSGNGAYECTLNNCALTGNSGSGASYCALNNCTLTGNSGGGASGCTLNNCIVYFNTGTNYDSSSILNYCCTTPLPINGVGNISSDPLLASPSHLSAASPCRGAGNAAYASGTDIDCEPWLNPPSIGCDEYHPGAVTGPLSVGITASFTTVTVGFTVQLTALIEGRTTASVWDFGDGTTATNQPYTSHSWAALGDYAVVLRAYNESQPGGISTTVTVHVVPGLHYVAANSTNPVAPYTSWATAATHIWDAIAAAEPGASVVVVSNGSYGPINIPALMTVRSVNGPKFTVIDGGHSNGCVSLTKSASLSGFTLTNGSAQYGGGVYCESANEVVSNCVVVGNWAYSGGGGAYGGTLNNCTLSSNSVYGNGGGASYCTLNNCALKGNSAFSWINYVYIPGGGGGGGLLPGGSGYYTYVAVDSFGGGAFGGTLNNCLLSDNRALDASLYGHTSSGYGGGASSARLNNCTLTRNFASASHNYYPGLGGGGASGCQLNNCIVFFNTALGLQGPNYDSYCTLNHSWVGDPLFVDLPSGNLRLQSNSPCINSGDNSHASGDTDQDGNPRVSGGTVDIGAYEFQNPSSTISYAWLEKYGFATDGSADHADQDSDGVDNYQEWLDGSGPTDPLSSRPVIRTQPASQRVTLGDNASFSVSATGTVPLTCQWRFNQTNSIPNATNLMLVVSNLQWSSAGTYSALLSNVYGSLLSSNAIVTINQPPVADASVSRLLYISPNNTNARVILDGSRSSDPDNDPLQYAWYEAGNATPLAHGVVAVEVLPVGAHAIVLAVSDGLAVRTNAITLEVITTAQAVQRLVASVLSNVSRPEPLLATLEVALVSINRGNLVSAVNQLLAFQNQARALIAPLDPVLAASLIESAQDIIDALSGGNTNPAGRPRAQFTFLVKKSNGAMRMRFTAEAGRLYFIEASTNLADWEIIGVAALQADGAYEFEDPQAARSSSRFYRVGVSGQ